MARNKYPEDRIILQCIEDLKQALHTGETMANGIRTSRHREQFMACQDPVPGNQYFFTEDETQSDNNLDTLLLYTPK